MLKVLVDLKSRCREIVEGGTVGDSKDTAGDALGSCSKENYFDSFILCDAPVCSRFLCCEILLAKTDWGGKFWLFFTCLF